jgi:hypothetical protein
MVRYKVKFDDEGKICSTSIEHLKRNPECGIYFIEDKPFNPHNKPPRENPFSKIDKNLTIDAFGKFIPAQEERPTTTIPRGRGLTPSVLKQSPFQSLELPQDETNELLQGKKGVLEMFENRQRGGYQSVPINNELSQDVVSFEDITYTNQEADTITRNVIGELDDLVGGIELPSLRQSRIIPEPPPSPPGEAGPSRDITEEELIELQMKDIKAKQRSKGVLSKTLPDLEELIVVTPAREEELIMRASKSFIGKDKPKLTFNDVKKILNKLVPKLIEPATVFDVLNKNNLYDATYEDEFRKIRAEDREFLRIFQKQNIATARERAQEIEMRDTNLVPEKSYAPIEPLEIEEYTGLIDRPGTGFEPKTRGIIQKELTKRAGKLPEEFSSLVRDVIPPSVDTTLTFDEEFIGELQEVQLIGERPSLSIGERIRTTTATELGVGGAGLGVGLGAGFATAKLLENIGVKNSAIIGATTGSAAGGATALTSYALERAAGRAVTGVGRGVALGVAEGGILGLATVPADMFLNKKFLEAGMSHTTSNLLSTTATAGTLTGLIFLAAALGAETGGASLVLAAGALAVSELIAFWSGNTEDQKEQDRLDEIKKVQTTNIYRTQLLQSLEKYQYDYTTAFKNFKDKDKLGMNDEDWKPFMMRLYNTFNKSEFSNGKLPIPDNSKQKSLSEDDKQIALLMSKYIARETILKACANTECSEATLEQIPRELFEGEINFLNDKTASTWKTIAQVSIEQSYQENKLTNKRVEQARKIVINNWKQNKQTPDSLDPDILAYANLDEVWLEQFKSAVNQDALNYAIDAYNNNQTKQGELPQYIRDALAYKPDKVTELSQYYAHVEESAKNINVSVEQYLNLQRTPEMEQKNLYNKYQFQNKQADPEAVEQAIKIASVEDKVKESGYYDIDIALLKTDPTSISSFRPTDSQIFIAHSANLTLQEYYNYIHELSKGKDGDFQNLPVLTDAEKSRLGFNDWDQFQEEVKLAGQNPDAYGYDYQNQLIFLKPQIPVNNIDTEAQATQDRRLHEQEENSMINSVVSNMMGNLHLERASEIQSNIEQTHREIAIDNNLNVASTQGVAAPVASS